MTKSATGAHLYRLAAPSGGLLPSANLLLMHGGGEHSGRQTTPLNLPAGRMAVLGRSLARVLPSAQVWLLRFHLNGWHLDGSEVLADARWAIDQLAQPGIPQLAIGHSLGGRVALLMGGPGADLIRSGPRSGPHGRVDGVVALAPWAPCDDEVAQLAGVQVQVLVGSADKVCPARSSAEFLDRAETAGAVVHRTVLPRLGHSMIVGSTTWHVRTAQAVRTILRSLTHEANGDSYLGFEPTPPRGQIITNKLVEQSLDEDGL